ncbi:MAG: ABC transporter ATP-binding protein [Bdellovibrionales bacterium]|nr:ABC transporter ATP-binding protein [Bdellovibrionales bacterium]
MLVKKFGDFTAVNEVNLQIPDGMCFGLLGPNGAGKSTFISMIYGVCKRTSGHIRVFGKDPNTYGREIRQQLGIVTQDNYLDKEMNVYENMVLYAKLMGVPKDEVAKRIDELLDFMSLTHKKKAPIMALSGGMQRRLVFVRALLGNPRMVILDEPTTGLDPAVRHLLWEKVNELKRRGVTVLITTHYMDEAQNLCDDIVVMDEGKVREQGSPKSLINKHCPGYMAFVSDSEENLQKFSRRQDSSTALEIIREQNVLALRSNDMANLQIHLKNADVDPILIRPTNLEDVFLKITGRELSQNA